MPSSRRRSLFRGSSLTPTKSTKERPSLERSTERAKRRSFAFMKYSPKRTNTSMKRTREHARQIAMQLSQDPPDQEYYEPPPSAPLNDEFSEVFPAAPELDVIDNFTKIKRIPNKNSKVFVENPANEFETDNKPPRSSSSNTSADTSMSSKSRTVDSVPVFPSKSTMQTGNVNTHREDSIDHDPWGQSPRTPSTARKQSRVAGKKNGSAKSVGTTGSSSSKLSKYKLHSNGNMSFAGGSTEGSTANTTTSGDDNGEVMTTGIDHGFSFDAFGLDAQVVEQEVSEAIKDLAVEWGEEFPVQSFESPNGSRSSTPEQDEDGFSNGFRLAGVGSLPLQVRASPAESDRSSLTNSTDKATQEGQCNVFKEKAGFHKSKSNSNATKLRKKTPDFDDWANFGGSSFGDAFSPVNSPFYMQEIESNLPSGDVFPRRECNEEFENNLSDFSDGFDDAFASFQIMSDFPENKPVKKDPFDDSDVDAWSNNSVNSGSESVKHTDIGQTRDFTTEVVGEKHKKARKKGRTTEEKKDDWSTISPVKHSTSWSLRSPAKQSSNNWGEDIIPDNSNENERKKKSTEIPNVTKKPGVNQTLKKSSVDDCQQWRDKVLDEPDIRKQQSSRKAQRKLISPPPKVNRETSLRHKRAVECVQQRISFESIKSRLKNSKDITNKPSPQLDFLDLRSKSGSELASVMDLVGSSQKMNKRRNTQFPNVNDLSSKFNKSQKAQEKYSVPDGYGLNDQIENDPRTGTPFQQINEKLLDCFQTQDSQGNDLTTFQASFAEFPSQDKPSPGSTQIRKLQSRASREKNKITNDFDTDKSTPENSTEKPGLYRNKQLAGHDMEFNSLFQEQFHEPFPARFKESFSEEFQEKNQNPCQKKFQGQDQQMFHEQLKFQRESPLVPVKSIELTYREKQELEQREKFKQKLKGVEREAARDIAKGYYKAGIRKRQQSSNKHFESRQDQWDEGNGIDFHKPLRAEAQYQDKSSLAPTPSRKSAQRDRQEFDIIQRRQERERQDGEEIVNMQPDSQFLRQPRNMELEEFYNKQELLEKSTRNEEALRAEFAFEDKLLVIEKPPKKLTYRERRELELKHQREEKAQKEAAERVNNLQKKDVAALIRKRVAANKRISEKDSVSNSGIENFSGMKSRLKKVSMESKITQFKAREEKSEIREPGSMVNSSHTPPRKNQIIETLISQEHIDERRDHDSSKLKLFGAVSGPCILDKYLNSTPTIKNSLSSSIAMQDNPAPPMLDVHELNRHRECEETSISITAMSPASTFHDKHSSGQILQSNVSNSAGDTKTMLSAMFAQRLGSDTSLVGGTSISEKDSFLSAQQAKPKVSDSTNAKNKLNAMLSHRLGNTPDLGRTTSKCEERKCLDSQQALTNASDSTDAKNKLSAMLEQQPGNSSSLGDAPSKNERETSLAVQTQTSLSDSTYDAKKNLSNNLATRLAVTSKKLTSDDDDEEAVLQSQKQKSGKKSKTALSVSSPSSEERVETASMPNSMTTHFVSDGRPALKNDPKYDRYFRMLKVGMPMEVVKHAMERDGVDPSVMDGDHNKPAGFGCGVPLKEDPKYEKYFKMLNIGLPMGAVQNAIERDGLDPSVMDQDHSLPANGGNGNKKRKEKKPKDTHRRTRLHWDTVRKVRSNSLWAKIDKDQEIEDIKIDEDEFQALFQAELIPAAASKARNGKNTKKGAAVRVIDSKRANNGGIILARLKITHDDMAEAVDRIDNGAISAEQMQNVIEYLPSVEEREALEKYMLSGGTDAAEKFDGLCECEKFMVAMMTVKHAKRKVRALLFRQQFQSCLESLVTDTTIVESACDEISNSVRLRKLLGIVLNVGNRLNTAGVSGKSKAGAFTLGSLLKLNHAKAFDKKTTFLHYIVLVVMRNNELLLRFKDDLQTVMKADRVYWDQVEQDLEEVENQLENVRQMSLHQARLVTRRRRKKKKKKQPKTEDDNSLSDCSMTLEEEVELLRATEIGLFTLNAIKQVSGLREKVETTQAKFTALLEYFGEEDKQEMQPHDVFNIIVTFCRNFEKAKEQVSENMKKKMREERKNKRANSEPFLVVKKKTFQRKNSAPLRASSHQPNMGKVVKDLSRKAAANPRENKQNNSSPIRKKNHKSKTHYYPQNQRQVQRQLANEFKNSIPPAIPINRESANMNKTVHNGFSADPQRQQDNTCKIEVRTTSITRAMDSQSKSGNNIVRNIRHREQTSMRHKAMERRRKIKNTPSVSSSSFPPATSSSDSQVPVTNMSPQVSCISQAKQHTTRTISGDISPRSAIRRRRRDEMRRQSIQSTAIEKKDG